MGMRINHNISAMVTQGSLFTVNRAMNKSLERLSTGLRINSAADDAAGLGVSENLRTQVRGMGQALNNTQDAISMLTIADGALNEMASIMQRMRELILQARNDTYTDTERSYMGTELSQLVSELDRIAEATNYNGMRLFATPYATDGTRVYAADDVAENARKLADGSDFATNDDLFVSGAASQASSHHFNILVGANYSDADIAALNSSQQTYTNGAANMITLQFAQMDSNALLLHGPNARNGQADWEATDLWDSLTLDSSASVDNPDAYISTAWHVENGVGMGSFGSADLLDDYLQRKFDFMLRTIDGGSDETSTLKTWLYGSGTAANPTGLKRINMMRAKIGAMINRLEHNTDNLSNQIANSQAAESLIRDVDFASETADFTKNQILTRSSTAMLAQANMKPGLVLSLLSQ